MKHIYLAAYCIQLDAIDVVSTMNMTRSNDLPCCNLEAGQAGHHAPLKPCNWFILALPVASILNPELEDRTPSGLDWPGQATTPSY